MELELGLRVVRRAQNPTFKCVETATTFIILVYLSGVQENGIEIEINEEGTEISISSRGGRSFRERLITGPVRLRTNIDNGRFKKVFKIPDGIAVDKIRARFDEQGILYIYMPKLARGCYIGYIIEIKQEEEIGEEDTAESQPEEEDNTDIGLEEEKPESGHFDCGDHNDDEASTQLEEPCTDGDDNGDVFPENLETEEITSSVEENSDELYESCEEEVKEEEIVVTEDASDNGKEESSSDEIKAEEVKKGNEEESKNAEQLQAPEESEEKQLEVIRNENSSDDEGKQPAEESEASPLDTEEKPPDPIQTDDLQQEEPPGTASAPIQQEESCEGDQDDTIPDKMEPAELETSETLTPNPTKEEESSDATEEREVEEIETSTDPVEEPQGVEKAPASTTPEQEPSEDVNEIKTPDQSPGEESSDEIEEKQTDTLTKPTEEPQTAASTPPVEEPPEDDTTPTETETPNPNPATEEESPNASTKEEDNNTIKGGEEEEVSTSPEQQQSEGSEDETTPTGTGTGTGTEISNPNPNPNPKTEDEEIKTSNPNPTTKEGEEEMDTWSDRAEEEGEGMGGERKVTGGGRRGGGGRPPFPTFPLSGSALMMGSAFILSLVVLVLHLLNRDGRQSHQRKHNH